MTTVLNPVRAIAACLVIMMFAAAPASASEVHAGLKPAAPAADKLKPGLKVAYFFTLVRQLGTLKAYAKGRKGDPGKPLPMLNYKTGYGNVLTSDRNLGVGAHITGFIKFDKAGVYTFKVHSNDGVELNIGGKFLFEDPEVHSDSMSDPIQVKVDAPGWYPLEIWYFQRKGTATLELFWQAPGGTASTHVPTTHLAHLYE